jgi:flavin reductase (DIM6/NTAB) family NADH-FMN oxidoreductase RutF
MILMKKNLGAVNVLYPMPIVLVGTEVEGKVNYLNIAHVGVIDMNTMSLSMGKVHHSNKGIKENRTLSINFPSEEMVIEADYVGMVSGAKVDKSEVFESFYGELKGAPMIKNAPLSMECEVIDILDMPNHDVFLVRSKNTYCDEEVLNEGKIDLAKVKPMLFDMSQRKYWKLGEGFANCWSIGSMYKK